LHSKQNNKSRWLWERYMQNHVWIFWQRIISTWKKTVLPLQKEIWCKGSIFFSLCVCWNVSASSSEDITVDINLIRHGVKQHHCSTIDISLILHNVRVLPNTWLLSYLDDIWVKQNHTVT
jgi:hypothetical protein